MDRKSNVITIYKKPDFSDPCHGCGRKEYFGVGLKIDLSDLCKAEKVENLGIRYFSYCFKCLINEISSMEDVMKYMADQLPEEPNEPVDFEET